MKTREQIESEIEYLEAILLEDKSRHSQLVQIDMLSDEGSNLRKHIARAEGAIGALKWVLSYNLNGK